MHPGAVKTGTKCLFKNIQLHFNKKITGGATKTGDGFSFFLKPVYKLCVTMLFKPVDVGAYNSTFAAASPIVKEKPELYKGAYLVPVGKIAKPSPQALNEELATELRASTERILRDLKVL
jgi:hypothetical protein